MCVLLTSDETNVISCDFDGSIKSWSFDGRELKLIWERKVVSEFLGLCLSEDERMIAAVSSGEHCLVYNRVDGTLIAKIATGSRGLYAVWFAGLWLLCGGRKGTVDVIDVSKKSMVRQLTGPTGSVFSIAHCPSLDMVAAGSDKSIHLWRLSTGKSVTRLTGHSSYVSSLLFHPINPNILISGSGDKSIRIWSVFDSTCVWCRESTHLYCP